MSEKACAKCERLLPLDAFYRHPRKRDGLRSDCKACAKQQMRVAAARQMAQRRAYDRARDPRKTRARRAVRDALRRGELVRPDHCASCGDACVPHGHHEDYTQPLLVDWLCSHCHGRVHRTEVCEALPARSRDAPDRQRGRTVGHRAMGD